jgi:hypothetical protein
MRLRSHSGKFLSKRQIAAYRGLSLKQNKTLSQTIEYYTNPEKVNTRRRTRYAAHVWLVESREVKSIKPLLRGFKLPEKKRPELDLIDRLFPVRFPTKPIPEKKKAPVAKVYRQPDIIPTTDLRGYVEKYFDSIPVETNVEIEKGIIFHPDGTANQRFENVYFFRELQPQETYLQAIAETLPGMLKQGQDYIDRQFKRYNLPPPRKFVRWKLYIRHPERNDVRDIFSHAGGPLPIRSNEHTSAYDFDANDFSGMVPDYYWAQGFLVAGYSLYQYTSPNFVKNFPLFIQRQWDKKYEIKHTQIRHKKTPSIPTKKTKKRKSKTVRRS